MGADRVFELARHLTERDREVALCLYDQQVLTTDQLTLLFFSSRRRAQDRLLFLYRQRVLDRFYPPSVFGSGKPPAHWLIDEAGAHLVAASLDVDRRHLDWQRHDDWGSHPQLAHRLEVNCFVTDLIASTLADRALGVVAWFGTRQADMLLVYRVDRLSRKVRQLAQLAEELDTLNVVLRSATEPFDTGSAAGRMMLQMLAVFAEFEHATIVDRISAGIERRAKEGRWFGGRAPFGYLFSNEERVLVPDPVKAPVVRRVFDLYARKRLGTRTIAQQLRDEDAPAPSAGWGHPAVHWIINNPTYVGKIRWRDKVFDGVHEPLVDEFTFAKAQAIMRERGEHAKRRGNVSDFVLSGLLRCGKCGKAYIGMSANGNGGRYHYYACTGRQKYGPKACDGERIRREKVEQAVLHQLISIYRYEQLIGDALAKATAAAEKRRPEFEQLLASIGAEIARAEQSLERYYEAFEQGKLSPERCEDRLTHLQTRLDDLRAQRAELELQAPHAASSAPTAADLAEVADLVEEVIADANPQETKLAPPPAHRRATRQQPHRDPADLPARHTGGLRNIRKSGPGRDRTCDLGIKSPLLYRLSYRPRR